MSLLPSSHYAIGMLLGVLAPEKDLAAHDLIAGPPSSDFGIGFATDSYWPRGDEDELITQLTYTAAMMKTTGWFEFYNLIRFDPRFEDGGLALNLRPNHAASLLLLDGNGLDYCCYLDLGRLLDFAMDAIWGRMGLRASTLLISEGDGRSACCCSHPHRRDVVAKSNLAGFEFGDEENVTNDEQDGGREMMETLPWLDLQ